MTRYSRSGKMFKALLGCKRITNNRIRAVGSVPAKITLMLKLVNY
jgi:hypothetical protein